MHVLLLRPNPGNERFGLGPFFRVEPLGLEYLAAALGQQGHQVAIADLRFRPGLATRLRHERPQLVGISCMHALEYEPVMQLARQVRRLSPDCTIVVGGHAASAYPQALVEPAIDAICLGEGERVIAAVCAALERGRPLDTVAGLLLQPGRDAKRTAPAEPVLLGDVALPDRAPVERYRQQYYLLNYRPVWAVETTRGCPYRCTFCSVWQLFQRSFRERAVGSAVADLASTGPHVFLIDDLFWAHAESSHELAAALRRRGVRKRWLLAQTRTDLVARQPELLEAWRPAAERFDIFFGFEASSDDGLALLDKDSGVDSTLRAIEVARSLDYGVTGNFLIDPDWDEHDFEHLWDFVATHGLRRSGFTIKTPLPGTAYFDEVRARVAGQPWFKYDMHHLLWQPKLGAKRFFELYAETWRRSVLNLRGQKKMGAWAKQVEPWHLPFLARVLWRTQQLMSPRAYLRWHSVPDKVSASAADGSESVTASASAPAAARRAAAE